VQWYQNFGLLEVTRAVGRVSGGKLLSTSFVIFQNLSNYVIPDGRMLGSSKILGRCCSLY